MRILRDCNMGVKEAAKVIKEGGIVSFPTETVYGLGADVFNRKAVERVFSVKRRDPSNPLIVLIPSVDHLERVALDPPEIFWKLVEEFWPGPLTIVLKKREGVFNELTGKWPFVAVRVPGHPVPIAIMKELDSPITGPSANISGRISPISASDVISELNGLIDLLLDCGDSYFGIESTIVDLTVSPARVTREGIIPVDELRKTGLDFIVEERGKKIDLGFKLILYDMNLKRAREEISKVAGNKPVITTEDGAHLYKVPVILGRRDNLHTVAKSIYKVFRILRDLNPEIVLAEPFNEPGIGRAIMGILKAASWRVVNENSRSSEFS
jgi:L-threonylcarbamoyladenylate synthase